MKRKLLSCILAAAMSLVRFTGVFAETSNTDTTTSHSAGIEALDGKKVIFIGNSHIYRGMTVIDATNSVLTQESRSNDTGYFYQMCKANGIDVSVTNWTFGSHSLGSLFDGACNISACNGVIHEDYLTDREFDYVVFSPQSGNNELNFVEDVKYIMNFFKEANPNVKFVCLGHASAYGCNASDTPYRHITGNYKTLAELGVTIADWGDLVTGIIDGDYKVPNAEKSYTKSSFIVSDGYHANALTGYLTTLFAYCAITDEKAEGQPYSFYNNTSLNSKFDIPSYIATWYTNGESDTNFHEIFASETDMLGLQQLADTVMKNKKYLSSKFITGASKDGVALRIGLLGDSHIMSDGAQSSWMETAVDMIDTVGGVDVIGFTGDLVWQAGELSEAPYDYLNEILAEGNISNTAEGAIPYIYAVGNHEYLHADTNQETSAQAAALFTEKMGQSVNYHQEYNGYHIVAAGANSYYFKWADGTFNTDEEWIMSEIKAIEASEDYDPEEPIFFIMHYPITDSVHRGISTISDRYTDEFEEFLSTRPNIINISGHTHIALQYPQTICQDLGFTAFQAPVIADTVTADSAQKHQLSYIDVMEDNTVKIYKIDLTSGEYIGEPWVIDVPAGADGFKYTDTVRANNTQAPYYDEDDEITIDSVANYSATITFPTGTADAANDQQDNLVRQHRITVTNKETGEVAKQVSFNADFWTVPQPATLTREITELDIATEYVVSVEPMSMFGVYGEPITAEFTTAGNAYEEKYGDAVTLTFDSSLIGETTDEEGTTSYDSLGSNNILLRQGKYFTYTLEVGEGQQIEEPGLYKLTYRYGSERDATVSSYVKWQDFDTYVEADTAVVLPSSGAYSTYTTGMGNGILQLREGTNVIKIAVTSLSNNDGIYMKTPLLSEITSATYVDYPINTSVYNAATETNGTGTGSITSNIATTTYQTSSYLTFRTGDYVVVPVMVPCKAAYEFDITAKSDKTLPDSKFKIAYTTESLEAAAALTSYTNSSEAVELTSSWQTIGIGDAVVLEAGQVYWFKVAATTVGRSHIANVSNLRLTDNGEYGTNANLASITVSDGLFGESFNADTTEYTVYADMPDDGTITLDAAVEMEGATLTGTGEISVNYGINTPAVITVTSQNGKVTKEYSVTFVVTNNHASLGCTNAVMYVGASTDGIDVSKLFNGTGVVKNNGSSGAGFGVGYSTEAYIVVDLGAEYDLYSFTWERTNQGNSVKGITIWGSNDPLFETYEALGVTYDSIADGAKATDSMAHKVMTTALTATDSYRYVRINKPSGTAKDFYPVKMDIYGTPVLASETAELTETITVPSTFYAVGDKLIVAAYDADNRMTAVNFIDAENAASTSVVITKKNADDTVKLMVWKSLGDLQPRGEISTITD